MSDFNHGNPTDVLGLTAEMRTMLETMNNDRITKSPPGESAFNRNAFVTGASGSSGSLYLACFTARRTAVVTQVKVFTATTAAAATPTLCRIGIYKREDNNDITLLSSIPNDTTLFAGVATTYTRTLSSGFQKFLGQDYAVGLLVVSGFAMPNFVAPFNLNSTGYLTDVALASPQLNGRVASQADLPASVASANILATGMVFHAHLLQ